MQIGDIESIKIPCNFQKLSVKIFRVPLIVTTGQ